MTGMLIGKSLQVQQQMVAQYAEITHDYNPIHLDPEFAARTPLRETIAHGTMSMNLIWASLADSLNLSPGQSISLELRFIKVVRIGSMVTSGGEQDDVAGGYRVWVTDDAGEIVIEGNARIEEAIEP